MARSYSLHSGTPPVCVCSSNTHTGKNCRVNILSVDNGLRTANTAVSKGSVLGASAWGSLRYRQPNETRLGSLREHVIEKAASRSVSLQQLVTIMNFICECVAGKPMAKSLGYIEIMSPFMPILRPTNNYLHLSRTLGTCAQNFYLDRLIRPTLPAPFEFRWIST